MNSFQNPERRFATVSCPLRLGRGYGTFRSGGTPEHVPLQGAETSFNARNSLPRPGLMNSAFTPLRFPPLEEARTRSVYPSSERRQLANPKSTQPHWGRRQKAGDKKG